MSQAQKVSMGCTMLAGTNKVGELTPDKDGYYTVVLGAYNAHNSAGMFYDLGSALPLFKQGSPLMRRLEKGVLTGEFKHPARAANMSECDYINRIRMVDEDRECFHIRNLTLEQGQKDDQGRDITVVVGEIKPTGPYGYILKEKLDNPHQNVYFSVRSLTMDDTMRGVKYTREIVTWDHVGEGGIFNAQKYRSPALETFDEVTMTPTMLWELQQRAHNDQSYGMETAAMHYDDLARLLGWSKEEGRSRKSNVFDAW